MGGEDSVDLVPCRPHPLHADLAADRDHGGDTDDKTNSVPASADDFLQAWRAQMAALASAAAESTALNAVISARNDEISARNDEISARIAESAALGAQTV